jgi:hypothetical protein
MDDTDVATVANVGPIYRLLTDIGMRTTKTVWPVDCPEGSKNFSSSSTLEDPNYLDFVLDLERAGFEIAYHGATMESSSRERTAHAIARFLSLFRTPPRVYANHAYNRENLYWGADRIDIPLLRYLYRRLTGESPNQYQGHRPGSSWWWGDIASAHLCYIRNLTFDEIDLRLDGRQVVLRSALEDKPPAQLGNVREQVKRALGIDAGDAGDGVQLLVRELAALVVFGEPEDLAVLVVGVVLLAGKHVRIDVRYLGKVATFSLMIAVPAISWGNLGLPLSGLALFVGWIAYATGIVEYYVAAGLYVADIRRRLAS